MYLQDPWTGRHPRGRPKKSWMRIVETDMRLVGASGIDALDTAKWKKQISRQTPYIWGKIPYFEKQEEEDNFF